MFEITADGEISSATGIINGTIMIEGDILGKLDTQRIQLAVLPLLPLGVPGLWSIGPNVSIGVRAMVGIGLRGRISLAPAVEIVKAEVRYPPASGPSGGEAVIINGPMNVDVTPGIGAKAQLEVCRYLQTSRTRVSHSFSAVPCHTSSCIRSGCLSRNAKK